MKKAETVAVIAVIALTNNEANYVFLFQMTYLWNQVYQWLSEKLLSLFWDAFIDFFGSRISVSCVSRLAFNRITSIGESDWNLFPIDSIITSIRVQWSRNVRSISTKCAALTANFTTRDVISGMIHTVAERGRQMGGMISISPMTGKYTTSLVDLCVPFPWVCRRLALNRLLIKKILSSRQRWLWFALNWMLISYSDTHKQWVIGQLSSH